jgi:hypothetical protein
MLPLGGEIEGLVGIRKGPVTMTSASPVEVEPGSGPASDPLFTSTIDWNLLRMNQFQNLNGEACSKQNALCFQLCENIEISSIDCNKLYVRILFVLFNVCSSIK